LFAESLLAKTTSNFLTLSEIPLKERRKANILLLQQPAKRVAKVMATNRFTSVFPSPVNAVPEPE